MQSYPDLRIIERSRSEATNHCCSDHLALPAERPDWNHQKSEANGLGSIPGRLSASPNWLALIDCSPMIPPREGFVLVARRSTTTHHVVRRGSQFLAQLLMCLVTSTARCTSVARLPWRTPTASRCTQSQRRVPHRTNLLSRIEIGEAFLLADYWYLAYLHRACHAMGLRHFDSVRRQRIVPF